MNSTYRVTRTVPVYLTSPSIYIEALDEEEAEAIAAAMFARGDWPEGSNRVQGAPRYDVTATEVEPDGAIAVLKTFLKVTPPELTEKRSALRMAIDALRGYPAMQPAE